jgi:hypothetical protein
MCPRIANLFAAPQITFYLDDREGRAISNLSGTNDEFFNLDSRPHIKTFLSRGLKLCA